MRVLITGAGGFIGSHLADACVRRGWSVVGLDCKTWNEWTPASSKFARLVGDVSDAEDVRLLPEFDLCFHLAAEARIQPSFSLPMLTVRSNIMGTARILGRAAVSKARVVYAGSSTADSDHCLNVYAASKHAGEELCRTWSKSFGLSTAVARFYNVYGPRQVEEGRYATVIGIFERQRRMGLPLTVTGTGLQRRDFTHVEDIVEGLIEIAERGGSSGEVYPLGSGVNHSILEVAEMFGGKIKFLPKRPGEAEQTLADLEEASKLGWWPRKKLRDYIEGVKKNVAA